MRVRKFSFTGFMDSLRVFGRLEGSLYVPCNVDVTGLSVFNGSAVSGNLKVGLADSSGKVVSTSASTAQAGIDSYQRVPFTNKKALVGPATYYSLVFID